MACKWQEGFAIGIGGLGIKRRDRCAPVVTAHRVLWKPSSVMRSWHNVRSCFSCQSNCIGLVGVLRARGENESRGAFSLSSQPLRTVETALLSYLVLSLLSQLLKLSRRSLTPINQTLLVGFGFCERIPSGMLFPEGLGHFGLWALFPCSVSRMSKYTGGYKL